MAEVESEIDALFGLDPEDFVAARDGLARKLRTENRGDDAARVKALRRPTVPAWVINQLVRTRGREVRALVEAGERLRLAQRKALSGVREAGLREAGDERRRLVRRLVEAGTALLEEAGRSATPHEGDIRATLEAASIDEDAAREVLSGRLSKEFEPPSGFGEVEGMEPVPERSPPAPKRPSRGRRRAGRDDLERDARQAELRTERAAAATSVAEGERQAREARRAAQRAERDASRALERAERLRREADDARSAARERAREARRAIAYAERAETEATAAAARLAEVEKRLGSG